MWKGIMVDRTLTLGVVVAMSIALFSLVIVSRIEHRPPPPCNCQFDPGKFVHDVNGYGWMVYCDEKRTVFTRIHIDTVYVAAKTLSDDTAPDTLILPR